MGQDTFRELGGIEEAVWAIDEGFRVLEVGGQFHAAAKADIGDPTCGPDFKSVHTGAKVDRAMKTTFTTFCRDPATIDDEHKLRFILDRRMGIFRNLKLTEIHLELTCYIGGFIEMALEAVNDGRNRVMVLPFPHD